MSSETDRREFIRRASMLIPAMHFSGWAGGALAAPVTPAMAPNVNTQAKGIELLHLRLRTRASLLAAMKEFYSKKLDLMVTDESPDSFAVRTGSTELQFIATEGDASPFYHFAFNIPENKLEKAITWMDGRAALIPQQSTGNITFHFAHWNAHAIYFNDPAGNVVEFIARHSMKNPAQGNFTTRDILAASEIGVIVPDVPAAAATLKQKLGVNDYAGTSATFAPLGDERGLIIVFPIGRNWLSSKIPTAVFPAEVKLSGPPIAKHALPEGQLNVEVVGCACG